MDYIKYAEEHKEMEARNAKESLEKAISMADKCSMMDEGMKPDMAPEVGLMIQIPEQKKTT